MLFTALFILWMSRLVRSIEPAFLCDTFMITDEEGRGYVERINERRLCYVLLTLASDEE